MNTKKQYDQVRLMLAALLLLAVSGCTVKLIASYDETTDQNVTALQRKMETFLTELETKDGLPECSYSNNSAFYTQAKVDLSAIKVRVDAIPNNDITAEQIALLAGSLQDLQSLHQLKDKNTTTQGALKCISIDEIKALRSAFNASFTAILKLELAKKRGEAN
jgi:hypothetical protein